MNKVTAKLYSALKLIGFNPFVFAGFFRGMPYYIKDYRQLKKQVKANNDFSFGRFSPILSERFEEAGTMRGNYFHQDLLVAQRIFKDQPVKHIDIGSRIDGFVAHVASFREIEIFDIRPQESTAKNIIFRQADLTQLPTDMKEYCDSISSLHAIEHFGLGRYGDPIDVDGHLKAIDNIHSMLKPNGRFYFSVPIGTQRIEFNEQRVFSIAYLLKVLTRKFRVDNFNYVDDSGNLVENALLTEENITSNFNCNWYGCGIFELTKLS